MMSVAPRTLPAARAILKARRSGFCRWWHCRRHQGEVPLARSGGELPAGAELYSRAFRGAEDQQAVRAVEQCSFGGVQRAPWTRDLELRIDHADVAERYDRVGVESVVGAVERNRQHRPIYQPRCARFLRGPERAVVIDPRAGGSSRAWWAGTYRAVDFEVNPPLLRSKNSTAIPPIA